MNKKHNFRAKILERLGLSFVPISNNTVKYRIDKMTKDCQNQLKLDLMTTVTERSVLIYYVQCVDGDHRLFAQLYDYKVH